MATDYQVFVSVGLPEILDTGTVDILYGVTAANDSDSDTNVVVSLVSGQYGTLDSFVVPTLNPDDSFSSIFTFQFLSYDVLFAAGTFKILIGTVNAVGDVGSAVNDGGWAFQVDGTLGRSHRRRSGSR